MKIAMIGQKRVPSREGGIEVVVGELSTKMVELGHSVDCYNRWEDFHTKPPKKFGKVRLIQIPTPKKGGVNAFVYSVLAVIRAIAGRYDVIHIHAEGPAAMCFLPKLLNIPVVVTIHGLDWQRAKWGKFASRYLKFGEEQAAAHADRVIVLSRNVQDYFLETYGRETIYVNNGVSISTNPAPDRIREKWGLEKDGYILFLGRLVPEKGIHYLIEAFRRIDTDKKLVIAGQLNRGEYVQSLKKLAEGDDRILFTNFVEGQEMEELMGNAGLYVLPSDIEGMPMSLLEAMSRGTNCLISDIPENIETARQFACSFKHSSVDDLQEKMEMILKGEYAFEPDAQIRYVAENYDWSHVTANTLSIYEDLLREKKFAVNVGWRMGLK